MPWPVIKQLSRHMDKKQSDMNDFTGSEEAALFKNLKRMLGSKDKD